MQGSSPEDASGRAAIAASWGAQRDQPTYPLAERRDLPGDRCPQGQPGLPHAWFVHLLL